MIKNPNLLLCFKIEFWLKIVITQIYYLLLKSHSVLYEYSGCTEVEMQSSIAYIGILILSKVFSTIDIH